jgi:hypothetical protein
MNNPGDRLFLAQNWHVDCRLVVELPEDSVVGLRFMAFAITSAFALAALLFTGWIVYTDLNLRSQIDSGQQRIEGDRWDVIEIKRLQRFYEGESKKIESAYAEMKNPLLLSAFVTEIGHTLPDRMVIDSIAWNDGRVTLRGTLRESSGRASLILGDYVSKLRADPEVGPHFASITLTALNRSPEDEQVMGYEVTMHLRPRSP